MTSESGLVFKVVFNAKAPAVVRTARTVAPTAAPTVETTTEPPAAPSRPTAAHARTLRLEPTKTEGPTRLARMLALAYVVEREIDAGRCRDYTAAAERLGISRARMAQVAALATLAPDIQERIVNGEIEVTERDLRSFAGVIEWSRQRRDIKKLT